MQNKKLLDKAHQKMQLVDNLGNPTGETADRSRCHTTPGIKHLAIQVLVFNSRNELILHKRPNKKVGGGVWDSPTTHVLVGETRDEAAWRCLKDEYGIGEKLPQTQLGGYSYEYDYGDGTSENEFCIVNLTVFDGKVNPNQEEVLGKSIRKSIKKVVEELKKKPDEYPVWFHKTMGIVMGSRESRGFQG